MDREDYQDWQYDNEQYYNSNEESDQDSSDFGEDQDQEQDHEDHDAEYNIDGDGDGDGDGDEFDLDFEDAEMLGDNISIGEEFDNRIDELEELGEQGFGEEGDDGDDGEDGGYEDDLWDSLAEVGFESRPKLIKEESYVDQLFNFDKYKLQQTITVQQERNITYEIDEIPIKNLTFPLMLPGSQLNRAQKYIMFEDRAGRSFDGILRVRRQQRHGGTVEILCQHRYSYISGLKEMKIQLKVSQIDKLFYLQSHKQAILQFTGSPAFFSNELTPDTRYLHKQKSNQYRSSQRYLSGFMIGQDALNGTLNIKHSSKKWDRLENLAMTAFEDGDLVMKFLGGRSRVAVLGVGGVRDFRELAKVLASLAKIETVELREKPILCDISQLAPQFSSRNIENKLKQIQTKHPFLAFQIAFSLVSLLYQCSYVDLKQVDDVIDHINSVVKGSENEQEETAMVEKIRDIFAGLNVEELHLKMQAGMGLLRVFKMKLKRKEKKKLNFKDNIQVKALKATPSGLLPAGWTRDLRNRMVRQFNTSDYQFLKIEVTDDDDLRSKLFNGGQVMRKILFKQLTNVKIFDFSYQPIGWTQSQLKTNSLWYTYVPTHQTNLNKLKVVPREELVNFLGKFDHIKNAALKAARIGQNLSTAKSVDLREVMVKYCDDDKSGKYIYTDGIGTISPDLVRKLRKQLQIPATAFQIRYLGCKGILLINHRLPPNTICMRDSMKKFECPHPDAKKFFDVLDYNYYKPGYLNRQILILLSANKIPNQNLKDVQKQYIKEILEEGLRFQQLTENTKGDFDLASGFKEKCFSQFDPDKQKIDNINDIIKLLGSKKQIQIIREPVLRGLLIQKYYQMFERLVKRSHIRVEKSARILGVIDDYGILKEDEVYCTILKDQNTKGLNRKGLKRKMKIMYKKIVKFQEDHTNQKEQQSTTGENVKRNKRIIDLSKLSKAQKQMIKNYQQLKKKMIRKNISGKVMVTKNPCMHPADIRVLNCVSKEEAEARFMQAHKCKNLFEEMPNCVIFPKCGKIPITVQISGSDLDGDTFFITWDQRLIPKGNLPPFIVDDEKKEERDWSGNDFDQMISFFCEFVFNNNLGRLANSHLVYADKANDAFYYKCIELCKIHSKAVDYPKKGYNFQFPREYWVKQYPHFMEKGKEKKSYRSCSVVGELYDQAMGYYKEFVQRSQETKYNLGDIRQYMTIEFTEDEVKEACAAVVDFSREVSGLLKMYELEREFQLYTLRVSTKSKESRSKVSFIDDIRLKYFMRFFYKFDKPFRYIRRLKQGKEKLSAEILKKAILWYLVSYFELLQADCKLDHEKKFVDKVRKYLKGNKIKNIGLCWFSIPYITYLMLRFTASQHKATSKK